MSVNKRINNNLLVISEYMDELELDNCRLRNSDEILNNVIAEKDKEIERLNNIIKEVREKVKGIKEVNNEVYKQIDMLESFYSRKWCEDITDDILEILDKGE